MAKTCTCLIDFTKLNAAGNDFICIDNTDGRFNEVMGNDAMCNFVRRVCKRGLGVGADGLILACERGTGAGVDIVARFLEPDGSEAKLCGNGTACFTYWLVDSGMLPGPEVTILTGAGTATGRLREDEPHCVRVCVPNPKHLEWDIEVEAAGKHRLLDYADTGVPHVVLRVREGLDEIDLMHLALPLRWHPSFAPEGVNVNVVQVEQVGEISVRTFEFGVESETLACGTGSAAAAILTAVREQWPEDILRGNRPVSVRVRSGATLNVWFEMNAQGQVIDVCLQTRVTPVYDGRLSSFFTSELCADQPETVCPLTRQAESRHNVGQVTKGTA